MSKPTLYYTLFSPASRACLLTAKLINLDLELRLIDFAQRENHSDWYLKLNHRHTVPVLVDDKVPLCESHAILSYMISKYAPNDKLYPKDLLQRAKVDELLYYETGVLFQCVKSIAAKIVYGTDTEYSPESVEQCRTAYDFLEKYLQRNKYVAGKEMTIADLSINATLITLNKFVPLDKTSFPKTLEWIEQMKTVPGYLDINEQGSQQLYARIEGALAQNRLKAGSSSKQVG